MDELTDGLKTEIKANVYVSSSRREDTDSFDLAVTFTLIHSVYWMVTDNMKT